MTYLVLVSHGDFARGLKNSLGMFAGDEIEKVRVFGLQPGESTDNFGKRFLCEVEKLPQETRLIVLADIVGGSPLATICKVLDKQKNARKFSDCWRSEFSNGFKCASIERN